MYWAALHTLRPSTLRITHRQTSSSSTPVSTIGHLQMVFRIIAHDDGTFNTKVVLFLKVSLGTSLSLQSRHWVFVLTTGPTILSRAPHISGSPEKKRINEARNKIPNHSPSHCLPSRKQTLALISIELSPPRHIQVQKVLSFWMPLSLKQSELINTSL